MGKSNYKAAAQLLKLKKKNVSIICIAANFIQKIT